MQILRSLAFGVAIGASAAVCLAGSASSFFQVNITLYTQAPPVVPAPPDPGGGDAPVVPPPPGLPGQPGPGPAPEPLPGLPGAPGAGAGTSTPPPAVGGLPDSPPPGLAGTVPPNGICTSQAGGNAGAATVRVICSTGQFVSIDAVPGQPFALTHGGAYRFSFGPGLPLPALAANMSMNIGAGTVTALRILGVDGAQAPLEMLVSF